MYWEIYLIVGFIIAVWPHDTDVHVPFSSTLAITLLWPFYIITRLIK